MTLPNRAHGQQSPKLTTVNYGTITISALHWPFLIAEQEGFLQKEGIDFKRVMGGTTTATSQALVAGSTDFAQINLVQLLAANMAGADLVALAGDTLVPIYSLIVHPSIKSYADLKGKRLAVAGPTDPLNYVMARMLAANGLAPSDYEMIGLGGTPTRLAAVEKGGVAGLCRQCSVHGDRRAARLGAKESAAGRGPVTSFRQSVRVLLQPEKQRGGDAGVDREGEGRSGRSRENL
jgi:ABC-type nitrate/sulfonate/bicarbonate transport system substrate-binding protein